MKWFALSMALLSVVLTAVGVYTAAPVANEKRLVCFDIQGNYKMSVKGASYRFEHGVIYGVGDKGEYAIFPMPGWLCSIVKVEDGK